MYRGKNAEAHRVFREVTREHPEATAAWEGAVDSRPDDEAVRRSLALDLEDRVNALGATSPSSVPLRCLILRLEPDLAVRERKLYTLVNEAKDFAGWPRAALADVFARRGNPHAALNAYKQATKDSPSLASAWRGLAYTLLETGRPQPAIAAYERYLRTRPNDPEALYNLAYILVRWERRPRDARPYLERALNIREKDPAILVNLGSVCLLLPEPDVAAATRCLTGAAAYAPEDPDVHYNLGILYADHLNDPRRATHHFKRYLAHGGTERTRVLEWITELGGGPRP